MCGFAAIFSTKNDISQGLLDKFDQDLFHRGPDSGGRYQSSGIGLVFRRLAIMDPTSESNQPMEDRSRRFVMVFNGEIYNFKRIRSELETKGYQFRTQGDSEVLLNAFIQWDTNAFAKLEGMFSCVILDRVNLRVVAARDPFGIKPLYLTHGEFGTGFSSEARPLRRWLKSSSPDPDAISELLMYRYAAGTLSNYKNIELLKGGHFVELTLSTNAVVQKCFSDPLDTLSHVRDLSQGEALRVSEDAIQESIRTHMQSDVGYSLQFSGGIDSSLVLAMVEAETKDAINSYAVKLEEDQFDEGQWRQAVLLQHPTIHEEVKLGAEDFAAALPRAIHHMDGPTPHFGCVMLLLLCDEIAKKHKVVLTGEGADEFFGGYERYSKWKDLNKFNTIAKIVPSAAWPFLKRYEFIKRFKKWDAAIASSVYFDFLQLHEIFPDFVPSFGHREAVANRFDDFRDRMLAVDQTSYLSSLLMRQDKMAMAAGVEARVPFTHMPLAKVVNSISNKLRVPGGTTKPLLKDIARKWLPPSVIDRRKVGLTLPLEQWLRDDNALGKFVPLLTDSNSCLSTFGSKKSLRRLVDDFHARKTTSGMPPLAHLINMELWLRDATSMLD
ncbi:asparagine synthase (glutamine-hydrolyzing) [Thalassospira sp. GO-4]|uniref:asparagine synthase (glutamine-hydrolyzing) n=1 Tax=Thalassospira sp. GO-4 TaxID=2946605 RepID=UPI0020244DA3|nr:asparagine synthase (glutamine-hydrolyzing) [Thalassospira sp. GO-4]URK17327.1 asparagine synthase (glutamine-hydrolyzing) [Thalassospira sp. GO-4]